MSKEKYIGIKFKAINRGAFKPSAAQKKQIAQLIKAGRQYRTLGFFDKNGGNLSARCLGGFLIKRTGSYPTKLKVSDFVLVSAATPHKVYYYGRSLPSSEARLHHAIYQARPDISCVLHAHDRLAAACRVKLSGTACVKPISYGTLSSANAVKLKAKNFDYIIQKNHGVVALGKNAAGTLGLIKKNHERFAKIGKTSA